MIRTFNHVVNSVFAIFFLAIFLNCLKCQNNFTIVHNRKLDTGVLLKNNTDINCINRCVPRHFKIYSSKSWCLALLLGQVLQKQIQHFLLYWGLMRHADILPVDLMWNHACWPFELWAEAFCNFSQIFGWISKCTSREVNVEFPKCVYRPQI